VHVVGRVCVGGGGGGGVFCFLPPPPFFFFVLFFSFSRGGGGGGGGSTRPATGKIVEGMALWDSVKVINPISLYLTVSLLPLEVRALKITLLQFLHVH